ncbi:hypothetical protein Pelo_15551 [Pelomyxa schiedti]|nr:hypothetical protein Pelo_15551 [Pelomyxa schiedti]
MSGETSLLADAVASLSSGATSSYACDECTVAPATLFCAQCGGGACLCAQCSASLHASRLARSHVVRGLGERAQAPPPCPLHPGEPMRLWCLPLCRECSEAAAEGAHAGHRVVTVGAAAEHAVAELGEALEEACEVAEQAAGLMEGSLGVDKDLQKQLQAKLDERRANLKAELNREAQRLSALEVAYNQNMQSAADPLPDAISEATRVSKIAQNLPYTALAEYSKVLRELRNASGATASAIRRNPPPDRAQAIELYVVSVRKEIDALGEVLSKRSGMEKPSSSS